MVDFLGPQRFQSLSPAPTRMQVSPPQPPAPTGFGWHSVGLGDPLKRASLSKGMIGLGMGLLSQRRGESWASALGRGIGQADMMSRQGREDYESMQQQERDDNLRASWEQMAYDDPANEEMYRQMMDMPTGAAVNLYAAFVMQKDRVRGRKATEERGLDKWMFKKEVSEVYDVRGEGRDLLTQKARERRDLEEKLAQETRSVERAKDKEKRLQGGREDMSDYNQLITQEAYRTKWVDDYYTRDQADKDKYIAELEREDRLLGTTKAAETRAELRYQDHRTDAGTEWDRRQKMSDAASIERTKLNREAMQEFKMGLDSEKAKQEVAKIMLKKRTGDPISVQETMFFDAMMKYNALFRIVQNATEPAAYNIEEDGGPPSAGSGIPTGFGIE